MHNSAATSPNRPVVAHSVNPWCPASWVYHQITGLKNFTAIVVSKRKEKAAQFPFSPVYAQYDLPQPQRLYEKIYQRWLGDWYPSHRRALERHGATLLHSHFCPTGMMNWRLARALKIPHVTMFYGADIWAHCRRPGWREQFRELATHSEMFLVEGNAMRDQVITLGAAPDQVKIFHLGLDLTKIPFQPRRPAADGKIHILMAGRAYEKKGHIYGLRAFARLAPKYPELQLNMIIGGQSAKAVKCATEMRGFIRDHHLAGRISWSEMLPYEEYLRRLADTHVFLQPSVIASDGDAEGGFPVTLTEMSAAGVPIVATRHCDIPEAVRHERTGLLADERDVDGLTAQLEKLIRSPDLWLAYGRAGREHVEQNYNIIRQIEVLEDRYRQLLKAGVRS